MSDLSPTETYTFDLPEELIAQDPPARRGDSRLLLVEPGRGVAGERVFRDLPDVLRAGRSAGAEREPGPAGASADHATRTRAAGWRSCWCGRLPPSGPGWPWPGRLGACGPGRCWRSVREHQPIGGRRSGPGSRRTPGPGPGAGHRRGRSGPAGRTVGSDAAAAVHQAESDDRSPGAAAGTGTVPDRLRRGRRQRSRVGGRARRPAFISPTPCSLPWLTGGVEIARVSLHVGPGTFRPPTAEQIARAPSAREFFHLPADTAARIAADQGGRRAGHRRGDDLLAGAGNGGPAGSAGPTVRNGWICRRRCSRGAGIPGVPRPAERRDGHWEVSGRNAAVHAAAGPGRRPSTAC